MLFFSQLKQLPKITIAIILSKKKKPVEKLKKLLFIISIYLKNLKQIYKSLSGRQGEVQTP